VTDCNFARVLDQMRLSAPRSSLLLCNALILTLVQNSAGENFRGLSSPSWQGDIFCDPVCRAIKYPYLVVNPSTNGSKTIFRGQPFGFGIASLGVMGTFTIAAPLDACSPIESYMGQEEKSWIALIARGDCDFSTKALNAEKAGAMAVVIYNNDESDIFDHIYCPSPGSPTVIIPLIMISRDDGETITRIIESTPGHEVQVQLSPFDPLMGACDLRPSVSAAFGGFIWQIGVFFALLVVAGLCFVNRFRRLRSYLGRTPDARNLDIEQPFLSEEDIQQLKTQTYVLVEDNVQTDRCSICLEDFGDGEMQSVLPCGHCFHPRCVKEWLTSHSKQCPLCMQDVTVSSGHASADNVSDSAALVATVRTATTAVAAATSVTAASVAAPVALSTPIAAAAIPATVASVPTSAAPILPTE